MASDRQKYNFLAAWCKQLDQAQDEGDDLAEHVSKLVCECVHRTLGELHDRIDGIEQWTARADAALAQLDSDGSEEFGEEPDSDDDGYDDDELAGVEPPLERVREPDGRLDQTVVRSGDRPLDRRSVREHGYFKPSRTK